MHRHELGGNFGNKQTKRAQDKTPPLLSTVFIRKNNKKKIFQLKSTQWEVCSLVTNTTILRISLGVNWTIAKLLVEWLHRLSRITNTCFANSTISYVYFLFDKRFGFLVQSKVLSLAFFYRDSNIFHRESKMCLNMYLSADSKLNSSQEHDTEGKSNPAGGPMPDLLAAENPHGKTTFLRINILLRSESWLCEVATNNCNFREFPQSLLFKDVTLDVTANEINIYSQKFRILFLTWRPMLQSTV